MNNFFFLSFPFPSFSLLFIVTVITTQSAVRPYRLKGNRRRRNWRHRHRPAGPSRSIRARATGRWGNVNRILTADVIWYTEKENERKGTV